jgi:uncharacterized protein YqfA (UPF0365 family)
MSEQSTIIIAGFLLILLILFFRYFPIMLWIQAKSSGVNVSFMQLFMMRLRKVNPFDIVNAMVEAHKAGLKEINIDELEAHYLAGGHVKRVIDALVVASRAKIELSFKMAAAIDLAGRNVLEEVELSIKNKSNDILKF